MIKGKPDRNLGTKNYCETLNYFFNQPISIWLNIDFPRFMALISSPLATFATSFTTNTLITIKSKYKSNTDYGIAFRLYQVKEHPTPFESQETK